MSTAVAGRSGDAGAELGARAIELATSTLGVDAAGWFALDRRGRLRLAVAHEPVPWPHPPRQALRTYAHRFRRLDPFALGDGSGAVRTLVTDAVAAGELEFERLPFFRRYLAPLGLAHMASVNLAVDGRLSAQLWLARGRRRGGFGGAETAMLLRLHALLQAAMPYLASDTAASALDGAGLTPRERDVARVAATGASNADIARALHIAPGTVRTHLHRVFDKLGIHSRAQLVRHVAGHALR